MSVFDRLVGRGVSRFNDEEVERLIDSAASPTADEQDTAMEHHYDLREAREAANIQVDLPTLTADAMGATEFLSAVLAGSELVDDVPLKSALLKLALTAWLSIAEELGSQGHEWQEIRPIFDEIFRDTPPEIREATWQFFMRTSFVVSVAIGTTEMFAVSGLSAAARGLAEDPDILVSAALDFMITLIWTQLRLAGYPSRIRATYERHDRHLMVSDLLRTVAMGQYLSPYTSSADVQDLERFLLDVMAPSSGGAASADRSRERSRIQNRLRTERSLHREDEQGRTLVDQNSGPWIGFRLRTELSGMVMSTDLQ